MKDLTIISGKGGTGKTSIVASFATLAKDKIMVDADVDAADLHLVIPPKIKYQDFFKGGHVAKIDNNLCTQCGECIERCQYNAISDNFIIDPIDCEGCKVCVHFCPANAILFEQRISGEWFVSDTQYGPMVHAKLGIAEENSGLLVSFLRKKAKEIAQEKKISTIITDGPPGIGCPVIASVTGASAVLIVTEPTLSGMHDMKRVKGLTDFLKVPSLLCINKYDLNPEITEQMRLFTEDNNMIFTGMIPYDKDVTFAMVAQKSLVEFSDGEAAQAVKQVWSNVEKFLNQIPKEPFPLEQ